MPVDANTLYRMSDDVRYRTYEDECLLVHLERGEAVVISQVGGVVVDLLDGSRSVEEIVHQVRERFEASEEQIRSDTLRFLEELCDIDALQVAAGD